ncbi:unnamed protein product [Heterobilharzia americana]|nr:unnamed protein product [Heterobilharzia americana]
MGRSKQSLNNSAAKSPQPGVAPEPKNKRLTNGKTTPLKPGSKRPVPVGSDDSGSDIETGHVTDLKMSHKKLKLGDTKLEPEKHEIESEEDEDDEVEDDDEDDDDEDDDDEDDEDDTGDDDDEEDEDDDESEEGKTPKNLQAGKVFNAVGLKNTNKPESQSKGDKMCVANMPSSSPNKVVAESKTRVDAHNNSMAGSVLIMNGPDDLDSLKEFISKISPVTNIQRVEPAPILVTVANLNSVKNRIKSGKVILQGKQLEVILMDRPETAKESMEKKKSACLFVGGIPKSTTVEQLVSNLPNDCKPVSVKLLDRNPNINNAIVSFSSPDVAEKAFQVLSSLTLEGHTLRVSFTTDQQTRFSPGPKVMVLGFQGNPGHLRKEFPTCIDVQYDKNKKKAILKFPSLEVRQAAVSEPKFINGRKLKLSLLGGPELKTAMILGVSTDVKESEIKGLFDGVVSVTRDSTSSGNHQQPSITVEFKTATDCEKAISSNATLNGKRITIFLKGIFVDEVSGKKPETIAGLKQDEPPAKRAKAAAVVPGSGKLKVEVLGEVPKVEEISSVEDDDEEEDDDEDESEESDDSDDDDTDDMSASQTYQSNQGTSLAVYNLPCSASETEVQSVFPSAKSVNIVRSHSVPPQSKGMCILQFHNARDCQQAYNECLQGKEIGGQLLHAEFNGDRRSSSSENLYTSQQYGGNSRDFRRPYAENDYGRQTLDDNNGSEGDGPSNTSCTLTVSNLPYSASERDIVREFPEALRVALSLDEQGRSRGVAHVTFSNSDQCSAALTSCGNKMMGGRPMRGRIQRDQEHSQQAGYNNQRPYHRDQRDYGQRGQRDYNQRNFNNRDHSNQRENGNQRDNSQREYNQRDYSGQRDYANRQGRQFDYNSGRGERDVNRFQSGSANRGGSRDFGRNDRFDWSDQRRDRSPARGEPVRGYGSSKGPRITSAVIHRPGNASPSESSSSDED